VRIHRTKRLGFRKETWQAVSEVIGEERSSSGKLPSISPGNVMETTVAATFVSLGVKHGPGESKRSRKVKVNARSVDEEQG
jgi:hypothetical protein